jgi:prephenate dehydrogenase
MGFSENVNHLVIAGVGLIGGSVGLALKQAGFKGKIIGLGRRWSTLKLAIDAGAVDSVSMDFDEALKDADLLVIGTPVDKITEIAKQAIKYTPKGCIITDVGSTKKLVNEVEKLMPDDVYFVGAHPMAGSHKTGVDSANSSLFEKSTCIITQTEFTNSNALNTVSEMWHTIGAYVNIMSPEEHDFLIASASHLPHTVACALVNVVSNAESHQKRAIDFSATGFADMTRIASGSPEIWKGILLQNADMVALALGKMELELATFRTILENKDEEKLTEKLNQAKKIRDSIRRSI